MTTGIGRQAEDAAANFLKRKGFEIISQNWRTRWCEIDIVAQKDNAMYFCEVKYRASPNQGEGLEYITPKKLNQMAFAADFWVETNAWQNEYQLAALEVSGPAYKITAFIEEF